MVVCRALIKRYVYPDAGSRAAEAIKVALAGGEYDQIITAKDFAARLTADLRSIAGDKHLRVDADQWLPGRPGLSPRPVAGPPWPPRNEGGVVRADRLPGYVGYIEVLGFPRLNAFKAPLDRAMAALADPGSLRFVGLTNYARLLADPTFWTAFANTLYFAALGGTLR